MKVNINPLLRVFLKILDIKFFIKSLNVYVNFVGNSIISSLSLFMKSVKEEIKFFGDTWI